MYPHCRCKYRHLYSLAAIATAIIRGSIMYHDTIITETTSYRFHFCLIFALVKIDPDQQSTQPCTHVAQAAIPVEILSLLELPSAVGPHFHVLSKGGGGLGHCNDSIGLLTPQTDDGCGHSTSGGSVSSRVGVMVAFPCPCQGHALAKLQLQPSALPPPFLIHDMCGVNRWFRSCALASPQF